MTSALLTFENVHKIYDQKMVLHDVNLEITSGMVVGLLGKNGAGKTTLLRSALGLVTPDTGAVTTLGDSSLDLSAANKAMVGYVPQQAFGYEGFSIGEALSLHRTFYPDWDIQLEQNWLARFELNADEMVEHLSIGQRQALALIMAMAYRPKILILDEPVASLDPIARREFMMDLFDLSLESGSGVIFSTHITSDIERVATHVALLKDGEVILMQELDELKDSIRRVNFSSQDAVRLNGYQVLASTQSSAIISGYCGQAIEGATSISSLSLEQLFVELHS